jgi:hypothetical protein
MSLPFALVVSASLLLGAMEAPVSAPQAQQAEAVVQEQAACEGGVVAGLFTPVTLVDFADADCFALCFKISRCRPDYDACVAGCPPGSTACQEGCTDAYLECRGLCVDLCL